MADEPKWSIPLLFALIAGVMVLTIGLIVGGSRVIQRPPAFPIPIDRHDTTADAIQITQKGSGILVSLIFNEVLLDNVYDIIRRVLPRDHADISLALLEDAARILFGHDVSLRYDVLPLLGEDGTFTMDEESRFIITGTSDAQTDTDTLLKRFQASMIQTLQQPTVITRTLPPRGTVSRTIRGSNQFVSEQRISIGAWSGMRLSNDSGSVITLSRGRDVLIGNDVTMTAVALEKLIGNVASRIIPGRIIVSGTLDRTTLNKVLQESTFLQEILLEKLPASKLIYYSIAREGPFILHISLHQDAK